MKLAIATLIVGAMLLAACLIVFLAGTYFKLKRIWWDWRNR